MSLMIAYYVTAANAPPGAVATSDDSGGGAYGANPLRYRAGGVINVSEMTGW
jgi:hypothetical protein